MSGSKGILVRGCNGEDYYFSGNEAFPITTTIEPNRYLYIYLDSSQTTNVMMIDLEKKYYRIIIADKCIYTNGLPFTTYDIISTLNISNIHKWAYGLIECFNQVYNKVA